MTMLMFGYWGNTVSQLLFSKRLRCTMQLKRALIKPLLINSADGQQGEG
jgi:hypothetical protein